MGIESVVREDECVTNEEFTFGEIPEGAKYYAAYWVKEDGEEIPCEFTLNDMKNAAKRAARNIDDIPGRKGIWERIFKG